MNKTLPLLIIILLCFFPLVVQATEWVECYSDEYSLDFLVNPDSTEIIDFIFKIDEVKQESTKWLIEKRQINFNDRTITFKAKANIPSLSNINLESREDTGILTYGKRRHGLVCDWSSFFNN